MPFLDRLRLSVANHSRTAGMCSLLLVLCAAIPASAQFRLDTWTVDNGLPQNSIRAIHQTADGYLWLVTFDGVVRFDGVHFTVFNKSNAPGINSNRFDWLYEAPNGDL